MHCLLSLSLSQICANCTVELEKNKGPRDWQNVLTIMKFHYKGSLSYTLYVTITGVKNITLYTEDFVIIIEVCYIEVPL